MTGWAAFTFKHKLRTGTLIFEVLKHFFEIFHHKRADQFKKKEDNLYPTDDGEPSQKSPGSSDETEGSGELGLLVPLNLIEGDRVKVDLDQLQCG